jgi:hypothetical protein
VHNIQGSRTFAAPPASPIFTSAIAPEISGFRLSNSLLALRSLHTKATIVSATTLCYGAAFKIIAQRPQQQHPSPRSNASRCERLLRTRCHDNNVTPRHCPASHALTSLAQLGIQASDINRPASTRYLGDRAGHRGHVPRAALPRQKPRVLPLMALWAAPVICYTITAGALPSKKKRRRAARALEWLGFCMGEPQVLWRFLGPGAPQG